MKYWVFDLDGTLVDSLTTHFSILKTVFEHFGADFTEDNHQEVLKVTAKTLPQYLESKLGSESAVLAHDLFQKLNHDSFQNIKPFEGIEDLLRSLKKNGVELAVWTARDLVAMEKILVHTGLHTYFSICISGSCTTEGKPHPEGLQRIAEHFRSEQNSMIMVGDFDSDMLGAQAFGIKAIRVVWHKSVSAKKCEIAQWQFHQVSDFQQWINNEFNLRTNSCI